MIDIEAMATDYASDEGGTLVRIEWTEYERSETREHGTNLHVTFLMHDAEGMEQYRDFTVGF